MEVQDQQEAEEVRLEGKRKGSFRMDSKSRRLLRLEWSVGQRRQRGQRGQVARITGVLGVARGARVAR